MEGLIKASRAYEMTVNGIQEKCDEVICTINDAVLEATKIGDYATHILFNPLPAPVLDKVYEALVAAGYDIYGLNNEEIAIDWASPEADEPPTQPTAADENIKPKFLIADNSEDLGDYKRECVVKVGHLRDLVHRAAKYDALENAGVDNWEWCGEAYANACDDWGVEDMVDVTSKYWEHFVDNGIIRV